MSRVRTAVGALVVLVAAAGCSSGGSTPSAEESPAEPTPTASVSQEPVETAEPAPTPDDRACYSLGFEEALAPTSEVEPSDCGSEHTTRTYSVGSLDLLAGGHLLAVDSERAQAQPARECPSRLADFLGGSEDDLRLSVLRAVWFSPTVEESDQGASWYRCDVIALAGEGDLQPLSGRLEGVFGRPEGRAPYALCATAEPGTDGFERVPCSAEHSWRALSTVPLSDSEEYPGEDQVSGAGAGPCEDAAREAADDPLNFRWGYEWPTAEQWASGQRYGVCWTPA